MISKISPRPLTSSSYYLKLGTILGARCLFIYYSAGTKCEVTVLLVCKLINFLASFSSNTPSSTLALSFNINCQLRGTVSSCRCEPSISYLSNICSLFLLVFRRKHSECSSVNCFMEIYSPKIENSSIISTIVLPTIEIIEPTLELLI